VGSYWIKETLLDQRVLTLTAFLCPCTGNDALIARGLLLEETGLDQRVLTYVCAHVQAMVQAEVSDTLWQVSDVFARVWKHCGTVCVQTRAGSSIT
jgi:hypothetical protein